MPPENLVQDIAAIDSSFVLRHDRRRVVQFHVTDHPTVARTAQQVEEAFPFDTTPRYLLRDNDQIYGDEFVRGVKSLDVEDVVTAPHSPWKNLYVERMIGTLRRECLDPVVVLDEEHLERVVESCLFSSGPRAPVARTEPARARTRRTRLEEVCRLCAPSRRTPARVLTRSVKRRQPGESTLDRRERRETASRTGGTAGAHRVGTVRARILAAERRCLRC